MRTINAPRGYIVLHPATRGHQIALGMSLYVYIFILNKKKPDDIIGTYFLLVHPPGQQNSRCSPGLNAGESELQLPFRQWEKCPLYRLKKQILTARLHQCTRFVEQNTICTQIMQHLNSRRCPYLFPGAVIPATRKLRKV